MYRLKLKAFANADKSELSMIEVAHEILEEKGDTMAFVDLANEIQNYLGKSDEEIRERLPQFYTDLNVDGSFISLGDNVWGLRAWYPYDSVDEEVN
ncbi:DNA-directed RNA polymerase subunit delta, partial [Lacticaseibacillus rhamnosus]